MCLLFVQLSILCFGFSCVCNSRCNDWVRILNQLGPHSSLVDYLALRTQEINGKKCHSIFYGIFHLLWLHDAKYQGSFHDSIHGTWTPREEKAFTARSKIHSHTQIPHPPILHRRWNQQPKVPLLPPPPFRRRRRQGAAPRVSAGCRRCRLCFSGGGRNQAKAGSIMCRVICHVC